MDKSGKEPIIEMRFSDMKQSLDASQSYLVFENDRHKSNDSLLSDDQAIYPYLAAHGYVSKRIYDDGLNREYLVVRVEPGKEDILLGKLLAGPLPKEMVYYLYKATNP